MSTSDSFADAYEFLDDDEICEEQFENNSNSNSHQPSQGNTFTNDQSNQYSSHQKQTANSQSNAQKDETSPGPSNAISGGFQPQPWSTYYQSNQYSSHQKQTANSQLNTQEGDVPDNNGFAQPLSENSLDQPNQNPSLQPQLDSAHMIKKSKKHTYRDDKSYEYNRIRKAPGYDIDYKQQHIYKWIKKQLNCNVDPGKDQVWSVVKPYLKTMCSNMKNPTVRDCQRNMNVLFYFLQKNEAFFIGYFWSNWKFCL